MFDGSNEGKKIVLITGAGIGIGRATAKAFGVLNYRVIVTDVLQSEGRAVTAEIRDAGGKADFYPLNVRDTSACNEIVATVEKQYGAFDSVIANAGIAQRVPLDDLTDEKRDHTMDIDLKGVFRIVLAALPGMKKKGTCNIVAVSSIMGVAYGWDEHAHYSAAKSGVVGLRAVLQSKPAVTESESTGWRPGSSAPLRHRPNSTRSAQQASTRSPVPSLLAA